MAISLSELSDLRNYAPDLRKNVAAAIVIAAYTILWEDPLAVDHADRLAWANSSLIDANAMAEKMLWLILVSSVPIQTSGNAASDSEIQNAVNGSIGLYLKLFG